MSRLHDECPKRQIVYVSGQRFWSLITRAKPAKYGFLRCVHCSASLVNNVDETIILW